MPWTTAVRPFAVAAITAVSRVCASVEIRAVPAGPSIAAMILAPTALSSPLATDPLPDCAIATTTARQECGVCSTGEMAGLPAGADTGAFSEVPGNDGLGRHILPHHRARPDDRACTNVNAFENHSAHTDPNVIFDLDIGGTSGSAPVARVDSMKIRVHDADRGSDQAVLTQLDLLYGCDFDTVRQT